MVLVPEEHIIFIRETCARIEAKVDHNQENLKSLSNVIQDHSKRIILLEMGNEKQKQLNIQTLAHMQEDVPYETMEGRKHTRILAYLAVAAAGAVVSHIVAMVFAG